MGGTMMTVFVRLLHPYFVFLLMTPHLGKTFHTPNNTGATKVPGCSVREFETATQLQAGGRFILNFEYK